MFESAHLTRIMDKAHMKALIDTIWGHDHANENNLAIISCKPLPVRVEISK